jgi:hypothetical protein
MKLAKLSLAAIVVAGLGSSSFAADTLADAFKNGKVSGELKAWYFEKDSAKSIGSVDIINTGITLGYITDYVNGFKIGATMQSSAAPFASADAKVEYKNHMYGSGAILSEAYLGYSLGKTNIKVGRQFISTPLIGGSGSRFIKESFEGATVVNTDLPATTLIAGYVSKFQGRTSNVSTTGALPLDNTGIIGDAPSFEKAAPFNGTSINGSVNPVSFDGAYTVAIINKSISDLTLTAQYAVAQDVAKLDDISLYYTEANYILPMKGFKIGLDANYRGSKTGSGLDSTFLSGAYLAGRVSIKELSGFGVSFAAGTTSSEDTVISGMGNGVTSYTSTQVYGTSKRMTPNTDSYLFAATYDFSKVGIAGLSTLLQYGLTNQGAYSQGGVAKTTADITNTSIGLTYVVPTLKGLTASLQYETVGTDAYNTSGVKTGTTTTDELWFKAGYKF